MKYHFESEYDRPCDPPYELVDVEATADPLPEPWHDKVLVHTVHDGSAIPREYRYSPSGEPMVDPEILDHAFVEQRDWGADLVARELSAALGLRGFTRCRVARVLLDFNRFPGSTPPSISSAFERLAISNPFADALTHGQKMELLARYYDRISGLIEEQILIGNLMAIAIHTYDEHNASATRRPDVSIVSQPETYQRESRMPFGLFDPLYPDELAESTCSRVLRDRISLNLERSGFRVTHNAPYPLPEGSIEVRAQVWFFFRYLRDRFEAEYPATHDDPAYTMVWDMLLNTNLRLHSGEMLRGFLHRYRKVTPDLFEIYADARDAYEKVKVFLEEADIRTEYRRSEHRPSSLGIEVRKDLVCTFDERGWPHSRSAEQEDVARTLGEVIASAVRTYFGTDRKVSFDPEALARV